MKYVSREGTFNNCDNKNIISQTRSVGLHVWDVVDLRQGS